MLRNDYSFTDTLVSLGASVTLAVLSVGALVLRYVTSPIHCRGPVDQYLLDRCFQQEEIWVVPLEDEDLTDHLKNGRPHQTYHQWVPLALGVGALLCLLPHVIWRMLSGPLLFDAHGLLSSVLENQRQAADRRHVLLRDTAILLQSALKRGNSWLTVAALCRKSLACVTCLLHLVLVVALFRPQLATGTSGVNANTTTSIPLPVEPFICQLSIRQFQNVHAYAVECILPMNHVYSRGFTFLFYAFLLLAVLCLVDVISLLARVVIPGVRDATVQRHLVLKTAADSYSDGPREVPAFAQWLGWDGRLLLALTADYCGPLAAADLTDHLWTVFRDAGIILNPLASDAHNRQSSAFMRPFLAPATLFPASTAAAPATSGHMTDLPLGVLNEREDDKAPLSPRD